MREERETEQLILLRPDQSGKSQKKSDKSGNDTNMKLIKFATAGPIRKTSEKSGKSGNYKNRKGNN